MTYTTLPDGYRQIGEVDLMRDRRAMLLVNISALIIAAVLFLLVLTAVFSVLTALEFKIRAARIRKGGRTLIEWLEAHGLA